MRGLRIGLILILVILAFGVVRSAQEAVARSQERQTMRAMFEWCRRIEATFHFAAPDTTGGPAQIRNIRLRPTSETPLRDEWGTPLAIHVFNDGYEIRSAGADRRFDSIVFAGEKKSRDQDLVFAAGAFVQWPEGVVALPPDDDPTPTRPPDRIRLMTRCSTCHGRAYGP